jgi:hypothetical protein
MNDQSLFPVPMATPTAMAEVDWEFRQATVRRDEWNVYCKGLKVVDEALDRLLKNPPSEVTFPQVARLLEIVNKIGRIASGLGYDTVEQRVPENAEFMIEVDAILQRVFGKPSEPQPIGGASSVEPVTAKQPQSAE